MQYFDSIVDNIVYDGSFACKNIFNRAILDYIDPAAIAYVDINTFDDARLYMISKSLYGTIDHWWLLAIINQKFDIMYDIPMTIELIQAIAADQETPELINAKFEELIELNSEYKYMKVIKPQYMNKIILDIIRSVG